MGPHLVPADCAGSGRDVQGLLARLSKIDEFLCGSARVCVTPFSCLLQVLSVLPGTPHARGFRGILSLGMLEWPSLGCGDLALWVPLWDTSFSRVRAGGAAGLPGPLGACGTQGTVEEKLRTRIPHQAVPLQVKIGRDVE
jgi:hypothetical protein